MIILQEQQQGKNLGEKVLTEDERILATEQMELFSRATPEEVARALFWLKKYRKMMLLVRDFEEHLSEFKQTAIDGEIARKIDSEEYYANKTANAAIIAEGQLALYQEAVVIVTTLRRAVGIILDDEAQKAVYCRYIEGYSYKETLLFLRRGLKSSTLDRRLKTGIVSVANTLKDWRFFETSWNF
jgi:hypothetical protein